MRGEGYEGRGVNRHLRRRAHAVVRRRAPCELNVANTPGAPAGASYRQFEVGTLPRRLFPLLRRVTFDGHELRLPAPFPKPLSPGVLR